MVILAIDTTEILQIALYKEGSTFFTQSNGGRNSTSREIIPMIDELLKQNNCDIQKVDYIGCVVGPGSFTGIRIGVSVANALAKGGNQILIPINTFELIASGESIETLCLVDAGHDSYYGAKYNCRGFSSYGEYTNEDVSNCSRYIVYRNSHFENVFKVVLSKIESKDFTQYLEPFYMKKSQAERMEKNGN